MVPINSVKNFLLFAVGHILVFVPFCEVKCCIASVVNDPFGVFVSGYFRIEYFDHFNFLLWVVIDPDL